MDITNRTRGINAAFLAVKKEMLRLLSAFTVGVGKFKSREWLYIGTTARDGREQVVEVLLQRGLMSMLFRKKMIPL